ncbi:MAG: CHAT domain-containing protein [Bacteroidetes bacterium]|nr:CHAT domain-containing protein [Bacteroidota bacterium]
MGCSRVLWAQRTYSYTDSLFEASYVKTIDKLNVMYSTKRGIGLSGCELPYGYYDTQGFFREQVRESLLSSDFTPGTGFVLYHQEGNELHTFLLTSKFLVHGSRFVVPDTFRRWLEELRLNLGVEEQTNSRKPAARGATVQAQDWTPHMGYDPVTDSLSNCLFPPEIRPHLTGLKHLIIQPQHAIGLIPFYILKPYPDRTVLFIDSLSYSLCPHICNFKETSMDKYRNGYDKLRYGGFSSLVVGDPSYSQLEFTFPELPGTLEETRTIHSLITRYYHRMLKDSSRWMANSQKCHYLTGKEATLGRVQEMAEQADIIYLACHGYFDYDRLLENSFIALTPDENDSTGFWRAKQIQRMHMQASLVVLSACQTGTGKVYDGGFIQIGRSFFIAGASNVVCSLWSVEDLATRDLMQAFFGKMMALGRNPPELNMYQPAQFLRKAMLSVRKIHPEPAKWASFAVYGFSI